MKESKRKEGGKKEKRRGREEKIKERERKKENKWIFFYLIIWLVKIETLKEEGYLVTIHCCGALWNIARGSDQTSRAHQENTNSSGQSSCRPG